MSIKIKAIIFDFDGLLVNTEELRLISFRRFLGKYGKRFNKKDYILTMTSKAPMSTTGFLKERYGLKGNIEKLHTERINSFNELFESRLAFMEGVDELLKRIRSWPIKCAIASGRTRPYVLDGLTRLDVIDVFSVIVTPEDLITSEGKPDPEVFLIAASKLEVDPRNCLVLEDAPHGIEAAKAAGMKAIFVPNAKFVETYHEKADLILKNMHELTDEVMKKLSK